MDSTRQLVPTVEEVKEFKSEDTSDLNHSNSHLNE